MLIADVIAHKSGGVVTVAQETLVPAAARLLADNKIGLVVVCSDGGRLLGVLSERDIVRGVADFGAGVADHSVAELMTESVMTCEMSDHPEDVKNTMTANGIRHMPVMEFGKVRGMVSSRDLLRFLLTESEMEGRSAAFADLDFL